ncbi:MAG: hypothetical protein ACOX6T_26825, partial [Myxococcales bacterium]
EEVDRFATDILALRALEALALESERGAALAYLIDVGPSLVAPLARALDGVRSEPVRQLAASLVERLCDGHLELLLPALQMPSPPAELIALAGRMRDERVGPELMRLASGLDEAASQAALRAMATAYRPEFTPLLLRLLGDPSEGVRLLALRALDASNDLQVADQVARRTRARGFEKLSVNERRAHFLVVVLAGRDKALPQIAALLERKSWLTRLGAETRLCAVQAVGTLASPMAIRLLEAEARRTRDEALRATCERLIKEVRRRLERYTSEREVRDEQQLTLEQSTSFSTAQLQQAQALAEGDEPLDPAALAEPVDLSTSARRRILTTRAYAG